MANGKLVALAMLVVILLHASTSAMAVRSSPALRTSNVDGLPATMSLNGFEKGKSGGGPAECDGKYHDDNDMLVALSTELYEGGRRCQRMISITSTQTGRTVQARVVDECDTRHGCKENIVDTSVAVWKALGVDTNIGLVPVTWSDA
jgi:hypothetical protein